VTDVRRQFESHCGTSSYGEAVLRLFRLAWILQSNGQGSNFDVEAAVVIYMDDYRKAKALKLPARHRYDEELMCVNWNPAIGVIAMSCYQTAQELSPELPEDLATVDVDAFLDRVYALASQI
jgi:hypothetical protein